MLIDLHELIKKYNINLKGILHVGAHECEEIVAYEQYISRDKILWVEAIPFKVQQCKNNIPNLLIEEAVVSDVEEIVKFNVSNNGQSSSMLELGLHKDIYKGIYYTFSFETKSKLLKNIISKYDIDFNFLNFDIQGAELKALKGMEEHLPKVDYLYTEVNTDYVYVGCALLHELDEYLSKFGLHRVEISMVSQCHWGDALYIRK